MGLIFESRQPPKILDLKMRYYLLAIIIIQLIF